jgi:hypothetical protein
VPAQATRVLRPGPRPYVALGIVFALAAAIPLAVFTMRAMWADAAMAGASLLLVYGAICLALARSRIVVSPRGIAVRETLRRERAVPFDEIVASVPNVLGEPDHPVTLDVFTSDRQLAAEQPALTARIKPYRREDVQWLLALPGLKVTPPPSGDVR